MKQLLLAIFIYLNIKQRNMILNSAYMVLHILNSSSEMDKNELKFSYDFQIEIRHRVVVSKSLVRQKQRTHKAKQKKNGLKLFHLWYRTSVRVARIYS